MEKNVVGTWNYRFARDTVRLVRVEPTDFHHVFKSVKSALWLPLQLEKLYSMIVMKERKRASNLSMCHTELNASAQQCHLSRIIQNELDFIQSVNKEVVNSIQESYQVLHFYEVSELCVRND